jgi:hypothetical protein
MIVKKQLKTAIDSLADCYLELAYKIICQFPNVYEKQQEVQQEKAIENIFQEIADSGGLGIRDPLTWQREIREDRSLPFRGN